MAALQRVRDLVARWRGRGGRGGASGRNGKAGQWLWPWQQRAAAVSALGRERGREQRRGKGSGESEREPGAAWRSVVSSRRGRGSRRWPGKQEVAGRVPAGVGHARSSPSGVSWKETRGERWAGPTVLGHPDGFGECQVSYR